MVCLGWGVSFFGPPFGEIKTLYLTFEMLGVANTGGKKLVAEASDNLWRPGHISRRQRTSTKVTRGKHTPTPDDLYQMKNPKIHKQFTFCGTRSSGPCLIGVSQSSYCRALHAFRPKLLVDALSKTGICQVRRVSLLVRQRAAGY